MIDIKDSYNLKDIVERTKENFYLKLNKEFVKKLLSSFNQKSFYRNQELADFLGVNFSKKWNTATTLVSWYSKSILPTSAIQKLSTKSKFSWEEVENNLIGIKWGRRGRIIKPKFPIKLDKNLGSIVGHILGDGSIDRRYLRVFYSNQNKELLEEFQLAMKSIFDLKPIIWEQEPSNFKGERKSRWIRRVNLIKEIPSGIQGGIFYPGICGIILNIIFQKFAVGSCKKITKSMLTANKEFVSGLLRAFFDDEGSVYPDHSMIRIFQDDKNILENIRGLLRKFKIKSCPIRWYFKRRKKRFYFDICGLENFERFENFVGFLSKEKSKKLEMLIINTETSKFFRLKKGFMKQEILDLLQGKSRSSPEIKSNLQTLHPNICWRSRSINACLNRLAKNKKILKKYVNSKKIIWSLNSLDSST